MMFVMSVLWLKMVVEVTDVGGGKCLGLCEECLDEEESNYSPLWVLLWEWE